MAYIRFHRPLGVAGLLFCAVSAARAQTDARIDAKTRDSVLIGIGERLERDYIFPDVAHAMNLDLRARRGAREYDTVTSANAFAALLTSELRAISHDKHINVEWSATPMPAPVSAPSAVSQAEARERGRRRSASSNFGFRTAERLSGNIGYLALSYFDRTEYGQGTAAAAMAFLHNTDALLIDLRDNDGGRPEMVALLISYLVDKPTELTGIYSRQSGRVSPSSTIPLPDSVKYLNKNVYLLTSSTGTISAGEAFAYDLHLLKRATLVGEVSAGAANPGHEVPLTDHFTIFVPTGRAVSPISGTNWEGVGIAPDIQVPAAAALKRAHLEALTSLVKAATDAEQAKFLRSVIEDVEKEGR